LEFETVFMVGLEERVFPHSLSMDDPTQLEEERRICYVGMTRARKRLFLTYADRRRIWGVSQDLLPSRFLAEIPESCLLACSPGVTDFQELDNELTGPGVYAGRWVRHQAFGVGTVQRVEENGSRVVIHFPGVGEKRFLVEVAPLEWL
jgi:DNA helicase-2/ATP-dependent DNA helicase PcrA